MLSYYHGKLWCARYIYRYAVKTNSKGGVEYLDKEVLNFLSHAQDGNTVHTPDIDEWANGMTFERHHGFAHAWPRAVL